MRQRDLYPVHNMTLRDGLTEIGQVDVSIGIASYPQHTQSDSLLRAADAALYRAKELGRSRICQLWPPEDRLTG